MPSVERLLSRALGAAWRKAMAPRKEAVRARQEAIVRHAISMQFILLLPRGASRAAIREALAKKLASAAKRIREDDFSMDR